MGSRGANEFKASTRSKLAQRVGYLCSNPSHRILTVGPQRGRGTVNNIGVAAHITAAMPGGPRYDPRLTPAERSSIDNGIWLCRICATVIDNDEKTHTIAVLRDWKRRAEDHAAELQQPCGPPKQKLLELYPALTTQIIHGGELGRLIARFPSIASGSPEPLVVGSTTVQKLMYNQVENHAAILTPQNFEFITTRLPLLLEAGGIDNFTMLFNFVDVLIETRAHHPDLESDCVPRFLQTLARMAKRIETSGGLIALQRLPYLELLGTAGLTFGSDSIFPSFVKLSQDESLCKAPANVLRKQLVWCPETYYGDHKTSIDQLGACLDNPNYHLAHAYQALLLSVTDALPLAQVMERFSIDKNLRHALGAFYNYDGG